MRKEVHECHEDVAAVTTVSVAATVVPHLDETLQRASNVMAATTAGIFQGLGRAGLPLGKGLASETAAAPTAALASPTAQPSCEDLPHVATYPVHVARHCYRSSLLLSAVVKRPRADALLILEWGLGLNQFVFVHRGPLLAVLSVSPRSLGSYQSGPICPNRICSILGGLKSVHYRRHRHRR